MKNTVVIKGNKSGMTVILDPEAAYETLLLDIAAKFEESARFWGSCQMWQINFGKAQNSGDLYR